MRVEPRELDLELLGVETHGTEHAEAACFAHRGHDITAVCEGEDRELDAESVAELCVHVLRSCS
jgi:hypothetical protein